jgi:hypothetical protein
MFAQMERDGLAIPNLVSAMQGDMNLIHSVQGLLFARGICGADGTATCSPWLKLVNWMVDVEGDLKDEWDTPNAFKCWTKRAVALVEKACNLKYSGYNNDRVKNHAAVHWVVKVYKACSPELKSAKFMDGQGVPLDQDCRMFNFKHARTLFDTLAQGVNRNTTKSS